MSDGPYLYHLLLEIRVLVALEFNLGTRPGSPPLGLRILDCLIKPLGEVLASLSMSEVMCSCLASLNTSCSMSLVQMLK